MEEILEPGLAWMVMATEEGGRERIKEGNLVGFGDVEESGWLSLALALAGRAQGRRGTGSATPSDRAK
ncbi:hypothetical protein FNV43_RR15582 [Rhamnella rubrinervis]|uniref:Uncharacterized protein n=1 Tax=Rhamnella rubrinervis TaxID=2594499 RepID=A0A8K0ECY4_9ROSA|nr:hypothetical protein FNV43_RR15582 [Rhamnella rubrinervis]